ncbi:tRNA modification GTPase [Mariniflexile sp. AS56]|uniref:tRNA modification GTPase n=1 Tax=Mariniflexile sp. AS56 TaxID=3063957 RepID=UPI0026F198FA|nr:tRNA modification GTPase [Mariniflexile sp. AS56]MDO7172935.1 tRNA modification GTPase [Mariniflexile sp. AS56]
MKKQLLLILTVIITTHCFSQINFEKGYYIDNNNKKTECLIKNIDWKNNPTEFEYKISENSDQSKATIKQVKEFGVYNFSKYIRQIVNMDRSSSSLNKLSTDRNPIFQEEELFLNVLIDGHSNLYQYEEGNLVRYFYSKESSEDIEQLIFKKHKVSGSFIAENNSFRQQLWNDLKCQKISLNDIKKINYTKNDLIGFFTLYNQCQNPELLVTFTEKQKKDLFNLNLRLGTNSSSLSVQNEVSTSRNVDFENKLGFRLGIETEFILGFNKNKWAIIIEPTYQYFKSIKKQTNSTAKVDYKSVELPIGIRHYLFINNNSKLFINGSYILDFLGSSTISYSTGAELELTKSSNIGLGIGFKQNDTYSIEFRYHTTRDLLNTYTAYYSDYKTVSLILSYTVF